MKPYHHQATNILFRRSRIDGGLHEGARVRLRWHFSMTKLPSSKHYNYSCLDIQRSHDDYNYHQNHRWWWLPQYFPSLNVNIKSNQVILIREPRHINSVRCSSNIWLEMLNDRNTFTSWTSGWPVVEHEATRAGVQVAAQIEVDAILCVINGQDHWLCLRPWWTLWNLLWLSRWILRASLP